VQLDLCTEDHYGEFLVGNSSAEGSIFTRAIDLAHPIPYKYYVQNTAYYCVATVGMGDHVKYSAVVEWRNAFGELNAAEYPKLPFYGALAIVYALIGALWGFLYFQHRADILPIQVLPFLGPGLMRIIFPR
jgi:PTM1-like, N-terminal domain/GOST, seven transmembrane domain